MKIQTNKKSTKVEDVYIPEQASEEEIEDTYSISEEEKALKELHDTLKKVYKDKAPMISQLEAWKSRYEQIHISKVGQDRENYYIWRTLKRFEYKEMLKGQAAEDPNAFNEMLVEKCVLYPTYDFSFRNQSDAGIINTLGQQISYKSGFVSQQEALALIYVV